MYVDEAGTAAERQESFLECRAGSLFRNGQVDLFEFTGTELAERFRRPEFASVSGAEFIVHAGRETLKMKLPVALSYERPDIQRLHVLELDGGAAHRFAVVELHHSTNSPMLNVLRRGCADEEQHDRCKTGYDSRIHNRSARCMSGATFEYALMAPALRFE